CESLGEIAVESTVEKTTLYAEVSYRRDADGLQQSPWRFSVAQLAIATMVLIAVGGFAFWLGRNDGAQQPGQIASPEEPTEEPQETRIAGHATLRRAVDLKWSDGATDRREGDVLPNGTLAFDKGVAEIDFFCGATLIVEGPASLDIESDWSVRVTQGRLRANVPPAARGFVVKAAGSEIVDLGTEFALHVGTDNASVEVLDGEVELRGGEHDGKHLVTGQAESLKGMMANRDLFNGLSTVTDLQRRRRNAELQRFAEWKASSQQLRTDPRLIAYFPVAEGQKERVVRNVASSGNRFDGQLVGPVEQTAGRFGSASSGLRFDRMGTRVRTRIDGAFQALTFACWVKIDGLEHRYNALFMSDGYENGEPHWQIRDDGRLMFSVMIDDTQEIRHFSKDENRMVTHAGLHRVFYTKPFWDLSKSGQWFHLAAVYDPVGRRVVQYVNGQPISDEEIIDKFHITTLRIGPSEIGNWGQPFRKTPWFAVRNLNGTIDELAIFHAALSAGEIQKLFEKGKPLGY
ncbi:MAG: FecR domain-containing protein, partial [Planctomycetaceae bacterium]|nr:FecR domain-containing protein [Planctomycetaceae bacterium]